MLSIISDKLAIQTTSPREVKNMEFAFIPISEQTLKQEHVLEELSDTVGRAFVVPTCIVINVTNANVTEVAEAVHQWLQKHESIDSIRIILFSDVSDRYAEAVIIKRDDSSPHLIFSILLKRIDQTQMQTQMQTKTEPPTGN